VTIRSDRPDTMENGGSQPEQIIVGKNGSTTLRGLLEFDLSALEAAVGGSPYVINSVSLTVNAFIAASSQNTMSFVTYDLDLLGNNLDFDEATATYNHAPSTPGGTVGTFLSSVTYRPNNAADMGQKTFADSLNFRSAVQDALNSDPANTIRFMLRAEGDGTTSTSTTTFTRFDSDEATTGTHTIFRPALTVDYTIITPLPGAATAGLALMGGLGLRRSRRRA